MEKAGATEALDVIYEDEVLLVADKPAGILVHGDGTGVRTLTDLVADHLAATGRPDARPQAVQRLDVGTSGLVLFSLDKATQPALDAQVAGHAMAKRYLAVVQGRFPSGDKVIEQPLGRDRHDARRMRVCAPGRGKPALTRVRRLAYAGGRSLLAVELGSGRKHQIRVHLARLGFPIVGRHSLQRGEKRLGPPAPRLRGGARAPADPRAAAPADGLARPPGCVGPRALGLGPRAAWASRLVCQYGAVVATCRPFGPYL